MKKFEYKKISEKEIADSIKGETLKSDVENILNKLGEEGWEMISVTTTPYNGNQYFFKKEKQ